MSLSVTTPARSRRLSRKEHVKAELGAGTYDDALLERLIDAASAAIHSYCSRAFAREALVETLPGYGGLELQLERTPLISVSSVLLDSTPLVDYTISSRDEAVLYRQAGWAWTVQRAAGLAGHQRFPAYGQALPGTEEPRFTVTCVAGYILPEQFLEGVATVSAAAADSSFNDSAGQLPALLRAGDIVVSSGFSTAANNGRFVVTGTPTASKVTVSAALVDEAAAAGRSLVFEPPAECRPFADVEKACLEAVKAWYLTRAQDAGIVEKQVGGLRIRRTESDDAMTLPLPALCVGLLAPWVRRA